MGFREEISRAHYILKHKLNERKEEKIFLEAKKRLQLSAFLPDYSSNTNIDSEQTTDNSRIKVCLLHQEPYMYNMIHSLYQEFSSDSKYECDIVLSPSNADNYYSECKKFLEKRGIPYKYDFDCLDVRYDVFFIICIHTTPTRDQLTIRNNSKYCFAIPSNEYNPNFLVLHKNALMRWKPNAVFCEAWQAENGRSVLDIPVYATGNPKYDIIHQSCSNKDIIPTSFEGINFGKFKKVFFYNSDHIGGARVSAMVSFDLYAKTLFSFFKNHQDCLLIFRPYCTYIDENIGSGIWTKRDVEQFKMYCKEQPNIVWDEEDNDSFSLAVADAVISDVRTGAITHSLPIMKPIGIPLRWDMDCSKQIGDRKEKGKIYYYIQSTAEFLSFMEMVMRGENNKSVDMETARKMAVTNFDGKIAHRIKVHIEDDFKTLVKG